MSIGVERSAAGEHAVRREEAGGGSHDAGVLARDPLLQPGDPLVAPERFALLSS